ncbi:MAG: KTSC domain-containing protein, partial [Jatrophihabitantaceae bacterium]
VGYDPATNVLELAFIDGHGYRYFAVPASVYAGLLAAGSLGTFFAQRIRHTYAYERLPA